MSVLLIYNSSAASGDVFRHDQGVWSRRTMARNLIARPTQPFAATWRAYRLPHQRTASWDLRKTGSAAVECAFAAAGLLQVARFAAHNLWDVAGGVALVEAAGGAVWEETPGGWRPHTGFAASGEARTGARP